MALGDFLKKFFSLGPFPYYIGNPIPDSLNTDVEDRNLDLISEYKFKIT